MLRTWTGYTARVSTTHEIDTEVRLALYQEFVSTGQPPANETLARRLRTSSASIQESLERLAAAKAIVLQPESRQVLMANPLCAVPTPYQVHIGTQSYFGSCVWDALGIVAMLGGDAVLKTSCACCGEAMQISLAGGEITSTQGTIHFAIPAKSWWENIVFT